MDSKIPNIRFKGFTDAWEQRRLGEVTIYQNGKGYEDSQSSSGKFELINLNSISIDGGLKSSGKYIESADKTLLTDDLVMVLSDVGKGDLLGRVAIIPKDNYYVLNQRVALIRPKNKQQTNYLFSYINSHQRYFKLHGAGMSQLNISKGSVENFPLLLPSLPEQQQIGTFFAHLDTLISLHQRKCDQTKELKKTMLQKMFPKKGETVPEIRFPEFTDAWEQRKLGDEVRIVMGQSPNSENYTDDPNDYILVQGNADMKNGRVLPRVWTTQVTKQAEKDDLILSVRAPVGDIGKTAYDVVIGRGVAAIKGNEFIFQNLGKMKSDGYWTRYSTGSTFESINSTDIKEAIISVPAIEEQNKIGSFFKQLDNIIALHQRKCEQTKELKKFMLQKMFPKKGEKNPEIRFPGFTDDWEQRKLGEIAERVQGNDGRMDLPTLTISAANGWMDQKERFSGNIAGKEQKNYTLLHKGELSYNHGNSKLAKYGAVFSLETYEEALVPRVYHSFKVINGSSKFIEYYFATKIPDRELAKLVSSGARMDGLLNINFNEFMGINLTVPNKSEQEKISNYFSNLDHLITLHQRKCEQLKELKKFMLQNMFPKKG